MAGYKISIPKPIAFLLVNQNKQLENVFEKWYLYNNIKKYKTSRNKFNKISVGLIWRKI